MSIPTVTLENLMDLELIDEAPDPGFFVEQGIKKELPFGLFVTSMNGPP
jgi:hypothetical protein